VASIAHSPLVSGTKGDDQQYSQMLSLRSRSKRLMGAVQDQMSPEQAKRLPPEVVKHLPPERTGNGGGRS